MIMMHKVSNIYLSIYLSIYHVDCHLWLWCTRYLSFYHSIYHVGGLHLWLWCTSILTKSFWMNGLFTFSVEPSLEKPLDKSMWTAIYDYDAQGRYLSHFLCLHHYIYHTYIHTYHIHLFPCSIAHFYIILSIILGSYY